MPEPSPGGSETGTHAFDLASARRAASAGAIEAWIHAYLVGGPWANPGLSSGLLRQRRWWRGPMSVSLAQLVRCCGSEPEMEYRITPEVWERRVGSLVASFTTVAALPPLLAEYRGGSLSVRDGNHRLAAIEHLRWPIAWVVIWYNTEADYLADAGREPPSERSER